MKILFLGDIMGKIGREAVKKELPKIIKAEKPDLVLANGENIAHGTGITEKTIDEMLEAGINFFTSGNHIFDKPIANELLADPDFPVIRPANYKEKLPGDGERIIEVGKDKFLIINLLGRIFIEDELFSPFKVLDQILEKYADEKLAAIFVDLHAEATSEKTALGWYADGRVSALVSTHTHIPTADHRILPQGTAYCSDVGMCGARDSVIGEDKEAVIKHFLEETPHSVELPENGPAIINSVLIEVDSETQKALRIKRIDLETEV